MSAAPSLVDLDVVLASTSRYRAELLRRIAPHCRQLAPQVDETALPNETPLVQAQRLARAKAEAVAMLCPDALVIGSDQIAALGAQILGKPGCAGRARQQLQSCSGHLVDFHTAVCLVDTRAVPAQVLTAVDHTRVLFRALTSAEIARYVEREQPLDCAGSFKCEGLGITLFERIDNADPTALVGLPLIALCRLLRQLGILVL